MLPYFHHDLNCPLCPRHALFLPLFSLFLFFFDFVSSDLNQILFLPLSSSEQISSNFFPTCTQQNSRASCLPIPANLPLHVQIGPSILLLLVLLFLPRRVNLLVPPTARKGGADIIASSSILVALSVKYCAIFLIHHASVR